MQEVQLAAEEQNMANQKLQEGIDEAKMKLVEYTMEIGEIVDTLEDEQAESDFSSQWFDLVRARENDDCEVPTNMNAVSDFFKFFYREFIC